MNDYNRDKPINLNDIILPDSVKMRVSEEEKDMLFESFESTDSTDLTRGSGLGKRELKIAGLILCAVLVACVPKIYLSNSIYYLSKDIALLQTQHDMLLDENKRLKHDLESLKYKFIILEEF